MDLTAYINAAVNGVPLVFVVLGLVTWYGKAFAIQGQAQAGASMVTGLVLGAGYMLAQTRPPSGDWWSMYVYIFALIVYGLGLGVMASGIYDVGKDLARKGAALAGSHVEDILDENPR